MKLRDFYNVILGFMFYGMLNATNHISKQNESSDGLVLVMLFIAVIFIGLFVYNNLEPKIKKEEKQNGIQESKESSEEENN